MPIMEFGKHAGKDISEVPEGYLDWMIRDSENKTLMCKAELERRKLKVETSLMAKIIKAGFDILRSDPSTEPTKLQAAHDALMKALADAAQP